MYDKIVYTCILRSMEFVLKQHDENDDERERQTRTHYISAKLYVEVKN